MTLHRVTLTYQTPDRRPAMKLMTFSVAAWAVVIGASLLLVAVVGAGLVGIIRGPWL